MSEELVVIARDPGEMKTTQKALVAWTNQKIAEVNTELTEVRENLETALKNKWKVSGLKRVVKRYEEKITYYEKIKAALNAGYVIIPNLEMDVFAIRTTKTKPKRYLAKSKYRYANHGASQFDQESDRPAIGDGEYRSPAPSLKHSEETKEDKEGNEIEVYVSEADEFLPVDFPVKLVKPQILSDTSAAMNLGIFDQLGIVRPTRSRDPIIVGQVLYGTGFSQRRVSFLITWWMTESDLAV